MSLCCQPTTDSHNGHALAEVCTVPMLLVNGMFFQPTCVCFNGSFPSEPGIVSYLSVSSAPCSRRESLDINGRVFVLTGYPSSHNQPYQSTDPNQWSGIILSLSLDFQPRVVAALLSVVFHLLLLPLLHPFNSLFPGQPG